MAFFRTFARLFGQRSKKSARNFFYVVISRVSDIYGPILGGDLEDQKNRPRTFILYPHFIIAWTTIWKHWQHIYRIGTTISKHLDHHWQPPIFVLLVLPMWSKNRIVILHHLYAFQVISPIFSLQREE